MSRFIKLLDTLNDYFKLPIIIIAQNWNLDDFNLKYCNNITVVSYKNKLGITKARIKLREALINSEYDYFILLEDDADIKCTQEGANRYLKEIDEHPSGIGVFHSWLRLYAISKDMYEKCNFDYIKDLDVTRYEVWDDIAWRYVWENIYKDKVYKFSKYQIDEVSKMSVKDDYSTWCKIENESFISKATAKIKREWLAHERIK